MADKDVWALTAISSPAATDRVPIATGSGAGGYSLRSDFIWRGSDGHYRGSGAGDYVFNLTSPKADFVISIDGTNNAGGITIGYSFAAGGQGPLKFANASGEVARFDASGNFGLGTSAPASRFHLESSGEIARFDTSTARGGGQLYFSLYDPTGRKGYYGYAPGADTFYLWNEMNTAIVFGTNSIGRWLIAPTGTIEPLADNAYGIGHASFRVAEIRLANAPIVTSDEREKTWRGAANSDELRAAKRIISELGFYQWNDAIAEKGDEARFHFGPRAQQVWAIMADEGLIDPIVEGVTPSSSYAFLCYDEWDAIEPIAAVDEVRDEEGKIVVHAQPEQFGREAGNRFGIRPDQLALFLIAAQEARLAALEA